MKAFITGGSGFIGLPLVQHLLEEGHKVKVLDLQKPDIEHKNLEWINKSIMDEIAEYIQDSCERRIALASEGHIRQVLTVLSAEMALAGALGQIDTVRYLGMMAEALMHTEANLAITESEDYQRRFGEGLQDETDSLLRT